MKKIYTKPEIFFENFSLSTNIAGNCNQTFGLLAQFVCAIPDANGMGMGVFGMSYPGNNCLIEGTGNEEYNGLCYHYFEGGDGSLFNS